MSAYRLTTASLPASAVSNAARSLDEGRLGAVHRARSIWTSEMSTPVTAKPASTSRSRPARPRRIKIKTCAPPKAGRPAPRASRHASRSLDGGLAGRAVANGAREEMALLAAEALAGRLRSADVSATLRSLAPPPQVPPAGIDLTSPQAHEGAEPVRCSSECQTPWNQLDPAAPDGLSDRQNHQVRAPAGTGRHGRGGDSSNPQVLGSSPRGYSTKALVTNGERGLLGWPSVLFQETILGLPTSRRRLPTWHPADAADRGALRRQGRPLRQPPRLAGCPASPTAPARCGSKQQVEAAGHRICACPVVLSVKPAGTVVPVQLLAALFVGQLRSGPPLRSR